MQFEVLHFSLVPPFRPAYYFSMAAAISLCQLPKCPWGVRLSDTCRAVHDAASNKKQPFADMPSLVMYELDPGGPIDITTERNVDNDPNNGTHLPTGFHGQLGFIRFNTSIRLPRHIHMATVSPAQPTELVAERILVFDGEALVELHGMVYIISAGSLVTIGAGVPHTWIACPSGVRLRDGTMSTGQFLMVYEYEAPTGFSPNEGIATIKSVQDYVRFEGDLDTIRFPEMSVEHVVRVGTLVWGKSTMNLQAN